MRTMIFGLAAALAVGTASPALPFAGLAHVQQGQSIQSDLVQIGYKQKQKGGWKDGNCKFKYKYDRKGYSEKLKCK